GKLDDSEKEQLIREFAEECFQDNEGDQGEYARIVLCKICGAEVEAFATVRHLQEAYEKGVKQRNMYNKLAPVANSHGDPHWKQYVGSIGDEVKRNAHLLAIENMLRACAPKKTRALT